MACKCINEDGTFAETCSGTCTKKEFKQSDFVQQRTEQSIADHTNYMLSTFLDRLEDRIHKMERLCMDNWKDGYKQGFEDGRSY